MIDEFYFSHSQTTASSIIPATAPTNFVLSPRGAVTVVKFIPASVPTNFVLSSKGDVIVVILYTSL